MASRGKKRKEKNKTTKNKQNSRTQIKWLRNFPLHYRVQDFVLLVCLPLPSTISRDVASTAPNGFLSWIFISPASVLRQSRSSRRLWLGSLVILTPPPSLISEPSLNQLTARDSCAAKGILNVAFWPIRMITGLENLWRSSGSNSGTSVQKKKKKCNPISFAQQIPRYVRRIDAKTARSITSNDEFSLCAQISCYETVNSRVVIAAVLDYQLVIISILSNGDSRAWCELADLWKIK